MINFKPDEVLLNKKQEYNLLDYRNKEKKLIEYYDRIRKELSKKNIINFDTLQGLYFSVFLNKIAKNIFNDKFITNNIFNDKGIEYIDNININNLNINNLNKLSFLFYFEDKGIEYIDNININNLNELRMDLLFNFLPSISCKFNHIINYLTLRKWKKEEIDKILTKENTNNFSILLFINNKIEEKPYNELLKDLFKDKEFCSDNNIDNYTKSIFTKDYFDEKIIYKYLRPPYINDIINIFYRYKNYDNIPINLDIKKLLKSFINKNIYRLKINNDNILKNFFFEEHNNFYIDFKINLWDLYNSMDKNLDIMLTIVHNLLKDLNVMNFLVNIKKMDDIKKTSNYTLEELEIKTTKDNKDLFDFNSLLTYIEPTISRFNNVDIKSYVLMDKFLKFASILDYYKFTKDKWNSFMEITLMYIKNETLIPGRKFSTDEKLTHSILSGRYTDLFSSNYNENNYHKCNTFKCFMIKLNRDFRLLSNRDSEVRIDLDEYVLWCIYFYKIYYLLKEYTYLNKKKGIVVDKVNLNSSVIELKLRYIITLNIFFEFANFTLDHEYDENFYKSRIENISNYIGPECIKELVIKGIIKKNTYNTCYDYMMELIEDIKHCIKSKENIIEKYNIEEI